MSDNPVKVAASILLDRLDEFERELEDDHVAREYMGHVEPATALLRAALAIAAPAPAIDDQPISDETLAGLRFHVAAGNTISQASGMLYIGKLLQRIDALEAAAKSPAPVGSEPAAWHLVARREILRRAGEMDGSDFAGDLEPTDDKARTVAIIIAAYDFALDVDGRLAGLVAGDQGYASTSIILVEDVAAIKADAHSAGMREGMEKAAQAADEHATAKWGGPGEGTVALQTCARSIASAIRSLQVEG